VFVYQPLFTSTAYPGLTRVQTLNQSGVSGLSNESNAFFGWAMAKADLDGDGTTDLAIGVPSKDLGSVDGGIVEYFRGAAGTVSGTTQKTIFYSGMGFQMQPVVVGDVAGADGFGKALSLGDFDGDGLVDIAIGTPKKWSSAGAVWTFDGDFIGIPNSNAQEMDQSYTTPE
jgi:hypothetical protein